MFSDFGRIIQKVFKSNVSELEREIRRDLTAAGILAQTSEYPLSRDGAEP
jgi:hypothetical protein